MNYRAVITRKPQAKGFSYKVEFFRDSSLYHHTQWIGWAATKNIIKKCGIVEINDEVTWRQDKATLEIKDPAKWFWSVFSDGEVKEMH